jgi:hypothetical protein
VGPFADDRVITNKGSKIIADLNTLGLAQLELLQVPTVLPFFRIQIPRGVAMVTEHNVRISHEK